MVVVAAETVTVPDAVSVPENVLLPVKVCVPARIASSEEVFGNANVRVVPVVIPDSEKIARLVGSVLFGSSVGAIWTGTRDVASLPTMIVT